MGTKLEVRQGSGDFESWHSDYPIGAPEILTFRWSTSEHGVTSAQWQVTDAANGFSQPSFSIIASGVLTHEGLFDIDFSPLLPVLRLMTPKPYYVRIVPFIKREEIGPSPSVEVTYQSPGAPEVFGQGFDLDRFEQNLISQLAVKHIVGYSYAIFDHVNLVRAGAGGLAVSPNVPQSPDKRMTTMSMSKTITAAAVMKLMEEMRNQGKDITVDSLIAPYLPNNFWDHGPHVDEMSFRHLLTHTSGLRPWPPEDDPENTTDPDVYANLRETIARGAKDADFGQPVYVNANFCLFRVLIPYMTGYVGQGLPFVEAINTGEAYVAYVRKHILEPIGLGDINVIPTGPKPYTRYYPDWSDLSESYGDPTDDTAMLRTGAGYWYMSAKEYAKFIASLRNGLIVSAESFALMKPDNWRAVQDVYRGLGMYGRDSAHGRYWYHNGGLPSSYADWMILPNGVTAVILVNSGLWGKPPEDVVENAFNMAYV